RMPGCSDVVVHGYNGYLVPPKDPRSLATRILDLLGNRERARTMGAQSPPLIRQRFELARIVQEYSSVYTEILNTERRGSSNRLAGARATAAQGCELLTDDTRCSLGLRHCNGVRHATLHSRVADYS